MSATRRGGHRKIIHYYLGGSFGDPPDMMTELADFVIAGIKRTATSLARDYGKGRKPTPKPSECCLGRGVHGHLPDHWGDELAAGRGRRCVHLKCVSGTVRKIGGSIPIAAISPDKRAVKGSS